MDTVNSNKWYNSKFKLALSILFWPLFLYGIYRTSLIQKKQTKFFIIGGFILVAIIGLANNNNKPRHDDNFENTSNVVSTSQTETPFVSPVLTPRENDSIIIEERKRQIEEQKKNTVTAPQLTATYEANEVGADNALKGKNFYVIGRVTTIKKDFLDHIYVTLQGDEMYREVQCYFNDADAASQLQKGMKVTFKGTCDGLIMGTVIMRHCELVDNLK